MLNKDHVRREVQEISRIHVLWICSMVSHESSLRRSSGFVKPISGSLREFNNVSEYSVEKKAAVVFLSLSKVKGQMSDLEEASHSVRRRRIACEKWKIAHRDYYLDQQRRLATRPEYKAHRREMYKERTDELKLLRILPRKRGRPIMYVGPEALEMKRQRTREAAARYRLRKIYQLSKNDESTTSTSSSQESDRCSCCSGETAQST